MARHIYYYNYFDFLNIPFIYIYYLLNLLVLNLIAYLHCHIKNQISHVLKDHNIF
jgi:hypothetical protein